MSDALTQGPFNDVMFAAPAAIHDHYAQNLLAGHDHMGSMRMTTWVMRHCCTVPPRHQHSHGATVSVFRRTDRHLAMSSRMRDAAWRRAALPRRRSSISSSSGSVAATKG